MENNVQAGVIIQLLTPPKFFTMWESGDDITTAGILKRVEEIC